MCGIAGIVSLDRPINPDILSAMNESMVHRGPDDGGTMIDHGPDLSVGLGNRRLSIIDLSAAGHQPLTNETNDIWIAYNGELYNDGDLRAALEWRGHVYRSRTDTETIVHAYEEFGLDCFRRLNGMFGLALYDRRRQQVILARDRMGIKPLYYWTDGCTTVFASELKTLLVYPDIPRAIDPSALDLYLSLNYVPSPFCILRNVYKLPPGHFALIDEGGIQIKRFWEPMLQPGPERIPSEAELIAQTRAVVEDAVCRQMVSDVPIGVLLSGGVDSTVVAAIAQLHSEKRLNTFSVGYDDRSMPAHTRMQFNEDLRYARLVSTRLGTEHHEVVLDGHHLCDLLPSLVLQLDEPFSENTSPAIAAVAQLARQHGVKVILSGDGSDELFAGYAWYESTQRLERYEKVPGLRMLLTALERLPLSDDLRFKTHDLFQKVGQPLSQKYRLIYHLQAAVERHALLAPDLAQSVHGNLWERIVTPLIDRSTSLAHGLACADLNLWVRELFNPRLDRMSMLYSVEARVPFQDNLVTDFTLNLPISVKIRRGQAKYLLRKAFQDLLPPPILARKKQAFVGPMGIWLRGGARELVLDMLAPSQIARFGLLAPDPVAQLVQQVVLGTDDEHIPVVWALFILQLWCDSLLARPRSAIAGEVTCA